MAEDSTAPETAAEAPASADTQTDAAPETDANTRQSQQTTNWEVRYKAAQAELTRKSQALAQKDAELAQLMSSEDEMDEDEDAPVPARKVGRKSEREVALEEALLARDWQIAQSIYEPEVIEAYTVFATMFNVAQTPADYISAAEAYHQNRLKGATPQQAAAAPAPSSSVMPRTDSNRSDAPSLPEVEQKLREAEKKKDLMGWVSAKLAGAAQD